MQGMAKGSNTRSSLLWQIERILTELQETDSLPQILLMENVTAIHSEENGPHFRKWLMFLDKLGYSSYVQDLNAWDYGIPQHRERTFVVSILGEWNYHFPHVMDLKTCIEDYLEDLTEEQALLYVNKSQKARDLLVKLNEENKLI
jgi:DNA (cytosine-5)-methyltransferase 1